MSIYFYKENFNLSINYYSIYESILWIHVVLKIIKGYLILQFYTFYYLFTYACTCLERDKTTMRVLTKNHTTEINSTWKKYLFSKLKIPLKFGSEVNILFKLIIIHHKTLNFQYLMS